MIQNDFLTMTEQLKKDTEQALIKNSEKKNGLPNLNVEEVECYQNICDGYQLRINEIHHEIDSLEQEFMKLLGKYFKKEKLLLENFQNKDDFQKAEKILKKFLPYYYDGVKILEATLEKFKNYTSEDYQEGQMLKEILKNI